MSETSNEETEGRTKVANYLRDQIQEGNHFFKSKFIAKEVGLSSSEIGQVMANLQESSADLEVEKWGNAKATTWYVRYNE